jgi:hypothetical protein
MMQKPLTGCPPSVCPEAGGEQVCGTGSGGVGVYEQLPAVLHVPGLS